LCLVIAPDVSAATMGLLERRNARDIWMLKLFHVIIYR
jgi:hypothetical protein